jgi:predicted deacylase
VPLSGLLSIDDITVATLPRGGKERLKLLVLSDLGEPLVLRALVAVGQAPGPTLLAVAGVHGDEYEGMAAVREVFAALDPATMSGSLLAIPVANPLAYAARTRSTPSEVDGLNLARVFPGDAGGTVTQRLAHHLLCLVERNVGAGDLFVDLHSGSADVAFAAMAGFRDVPGSGREASEEAARHFGLARFWRIPDSPGPFNAETARRGIPTIGTEITGRAGCDPVDVAAYVTGLRNLLAYLSIHQHDHASAPVRWDGPARPTLDLFSPAGGFFRTAVQLHDHIDRDARLGEIVDLDGDVVAEVVAPVAGEIWAWRATPAVRPGELIGMIAGRP